MVWKKISGVKGYQLVYAANSKFTASKTATATASSVQKTEKDSAAKRSLFLYKN